MSVQFFDLGAINTSFYLRNTTLALDLAEIRRKRMEEKKGGRDTKQNLLGSYYVVDQVVHYLNVC